MEKENVPEDEEVVGEQNISGDQILPISANVVPEILPLANPPTISIISPASPSGSSAVELAQPQQPSASEQSSLGHHSSSEWALPTNPPNTPGEGALPENREAELLDPETSESSSFASSSQESDLAYASNLEGKFETCPKRGDFKVKKSQSQSKVLDSEKKHLLVTNVSPARRSSDPGVQKFPNIQASTSSGRAENAESVPDTSSDIHYRRPFPAGFSYSTEASSLGRQATLDDVSELSFDSSSEPSDKLSQTRSPTPSEGSSHGRGRRKSSIDLEVIYEKPVEKKSKKDVSVPSGVEEVTERSFSEEEREIADKSDPEYPDIASPEKTLSSPHIPPSDVQEQEEFQAQDQAAVDPEDISVPPEEIEMVPLQQAQNPSPNDDSSILSVLGESQSSSFSEGVISMRNGDGHSCISLDESVEASLPTSRADSAFEHLQQWLHTGDRGQDPTSSTTAAGSIQDSLEVKPSCGLQSKERTPESDISPLSEYQSSDGSKATASCSEKQADLEEAKETDPYFERFKSKIGGYMFSEMSVELEFIQREETAAAEESRTTRRTVSADSIRVTRPRGQYYSAPDILLTTEFKLKR